LCADSCGGWPGIIQTTSNYVDDNFSTNTFIRNNIIHNSWGEGIIAGRLNLGEVSGNTLYDIYSVGIYLDNARNINVYRNYIYSTTDLYNRTDKN